MDKILLTIVSIFFSSTAYAEINDANKSKAWDCSGLYMANYFLPAGETFEYSMKEKSMASAVKSWASWENNQWLLYPDGLTPTCTAPPQATRFDLVIARSLLR